MITSVTIFEGTPYDLKIFRRVSRYKLSKAFLKSMKLMYKGVFHFRHCSMLFLNVKIWSIHPLPFLNPACSFRSLVSIARSILLNKTRQKTLDGTESSVMPHQLSQFWMFPFFGSFTISHLDQSIKTTHIETATKILGYRKSPDILFPQLQSI